MKKLTASLNESLGTLRTTASAVSAAAATQINRTLDAAVAGSGSGSAGRPPSAGPQQQQGGGGGGPGGDQQYLRLPVESARKLRWYDKGDVQQLTRQHLREKHALLDTVTALKKVRMGGGVFWGPAHIASASTGDIERAHAEARRAVAACVGHVHASSHAF
jgi:hypothetical protein